LGKKKTRNLETAETKHVNNQQLKTLKCKTLHSMIQYITIKKILKRIAYKTINLLMITFTINKRKIKKYLLNHLDKTH